MEATGPHFESLAYFLREGGHDVSVAGSTPNQSLRAKQTPAHEDRPRPGALLIADFCRTQRPRLWQPPRPEQRKLQAFTRHLDALKRARIQHENQREMLGSEGLGDLEEVRSSLERVIAVLQEQIAETERQMKAHVQNAPCLKRAAGLLCPGPGYWTALGSTDPE